MKSLLVLLSLTTVSFITSGCQPVDPNQLARERAKMGISSQQPPVTVTSVSITGNWAATCVVDTKKTQYRQDTVEIGSNYITSTSNYFSDTNCVIPLYSQAVSGIYTLTNDAVHGSSTINVTLSGVSVMPETDQVVKQFKQTNYCNSNDWTLEQRTVFTDLSACGIAPTSTIQIQRNGANELYLGTEQYLKK